MGIKVPRVKRREPLLSLAYLIRRIFKILPAPQLFRLFLDLEWIFHRFVHEQSFQHYLPDAHPIRRDTMAMLLRRVGPSSKVLDLGCGNGIYSFRLSQVAEAVVGVDHDKGSIAKAQVSYQNANLAFVSSDALAYLKNTELVFDTLILSHVLEHMDYPAETLSALAKHFKYIYIEVPDFDSSYSQRYRLDVGASLVYSDTDHVSEFSRPEMKAVLEQSGLEILEEDHRYGILKFWCKV